MNSPDRGCDNATLPVYITQSASKQPSPTGQVLDTRDATGMTIHISHPTANMVEIYLRTGEHGPLTEKASVTDLVVTKAPHWRSGVPLASVLGTEYGTGELTRLLTGLAHGVGLVNSTL